MINKIKARIAKWSIGRGLVCTVTIFLAVILYALFFYLVRDSDVRMIALGDKLLSLWKYIVSVYTWPGNMTMVQSVFAILLISPLLILVMLQIWHVLFHRRSHTVKGSFKYSLNGDKGPIKKSDKDELGREKFVRHIASVIAGEDAAEKAFYLGVYGEWGEGKTSVMNLVRNEFVHDDRIVFVDFRFWEHEAKEDLPYVLFTAIARCVADKLDIRLAISLFRYAVLLVPRKLVGIAGPIEWIWDLLLRLLNAVTSQDALSKRITQRIKALDAKIVVTVDDIDRLELEDIRTLLRVLRTSGDLPHFVYCILSARDKLIRGIADMYGDKSDSEELANRYLQKIVQMEIDLPPVNPGAIEVIFVKRLHDMLGNYGRKELTLPADSHVFKFFRFYVNTFRAMLRLVSELSVRIGFFGANYSGAFPVNLEDIVALSIVHLYDYDFWQDIFLYQDLILDYKTDRMLGDQKRDGSILQKCFGLDRSYNGEIREDFLREYFAVNWKTVGDKSNYQIDVDQREAEKDRRIRAVRCFRAYFDGVVPNLPEVGFLEELKNRLGNEEDLLEYFILQNKRGLLISVLDYLETLNPIQSKKERTTYLRVLVRLADMHFAKEVPVGRDPFGFEMTFDVVTRLTRCVVFMLRGLGDANLIDKGEELLGIFRSTETIVMLSHAIRMDDRKGDAVRHNPYFFTVTEYNELIKIFLIRVKGLQKAGQLIGYADEENIRRTWHVLLLNNRVKGEESERSEYRALLEDDAGKYPNVLHVLLPYRYYADGVLESYSPLWFESLAGDFNVDTMLSALQTAPPSGEWLSQTIKNFVHSIKVYEKDHTWPHPDAQERRRIESEG